MQMTDDEIRALRDLTAGQPEYCTRSLSEPKIAELCTRVLAAEARVEVLEGGLTAAIRCAKLALFAIRKQGVMPNSSWEAGFEKDLRIAEEARKALEEK